MIWGAQGKDWDPARAPRSCGMTIIGPRRGVVAKSRDVCGAGRGQALWLLWGGLDAFVFAVTEAE